MENKCRLNNLSMRGVRREQVYQAVIIDLTMLGVLDLDKAQILIGGGIPASIRLPNGTRGVLDAKSVATSKSESKVVATSKSESKVTDAKEQVTND